MKSRYITYLRKPKHQVFHCRLALANGLKKENNRGLSPNILWLKPIRWAYLFNRPIPDSYRDENLGRYAQFIIINYFR